MEVTQQNFEEALQQIEQILPRTTIVSLDLEMTGIRDHPEYIFDLPSQRYGRNKRVAEKYSIIQVGICLFTPEGEHKYQAYPFNFYVFPRVMDQLKQQVVMEASAVNFNSSNKMDWQKWITQGISYGTQAQRTKVKQILNYQQQCEVTLSETNQSNADHRIKQIERWYHWAKQSHNQSIDQSQMDGITMSNTKDQSRWMEFNENYNFMRKYYYQYLEKQDYSLIVKKRIEGKNHIMRLNMVQKEEQEQAKRVVEEEKRKKYLEYKGFGRVITLLKRAGRSSPELKFIGHNCLMDILFLYSHFCENPLPQDYSQFKVEINKYFPRVYDTKMMACIGNSQFRQWQSKQNNFKSRLEDLERYVNENKGLFMSRVETGGLFSRYQVGGLQEYAHEAGSDALLTGTWQREITPPAYLHSILNQLILFQSPFQLNLTGHDTILNDKYVFFASPPLDKQPSEVLLDQLKKEFNDFQVRVQIKAHPTHQHHNVFLYLEINPGNHHLKASLIQKVAMFNSAHQDVLQSIEQFVIRQTEVLQSVVQ